MAKSNSRNIVIKMTGKKRGPGRPRKDVVITPKDLEDGVDIPGLFQPTQHDVMDELSRFDSFSHREYLE
jgi:hypothetical protein